MVRHLEAVIIARILINLELEVRINHLATEIMKILAQSYLHFLKIVIKKENPQVEPLFTQEKCLTKEVLKSHLQVEILNLLIPFHSVVVENFLKVANL